jgi:hypothetical protein
MIEGFVFLSKPFLNLYALYKKAYPDTYMSFKGIFYTSLPYTFITILHNKFYEQKFVENPITIIKKSSNSFLQKESGMINLLYQSTKK